ncbi:hypothetical protein [Lysobacter sp. Root494]|uniref:hypothetical protein n=1 Tax=Lysobacter sp. Root494 TaxID=1736549 RepID=UPI0006FDAD80|nr:hypothetical protein [Lysobacter sp. Root494]KQY51863.1 hypothetical protein ASD14_04070 [Lysobacter sp. Root494]
MNKPVWLLPLLLPLVGTAAAQDSGACPYLAADTGLTWEHRGTGDSDFCRALREDGSEAFGLTIAKDAPFKPKGGNRAERVNIDGREVTWYRTEIAGTQIQARETVVQLPDGRVAYIWVQAKTPDQLSQALQQTQSMKFGATRLSSN